MGGLFVNASEDFFSLGIELEQQLMRVLPLIISFVNPLILFGLLAISIPIIIHLFNLRRVKKVEFSNTSLLKRIKEESSAKRKPVELLILLSRILAIALLVLAFAQPLFKDVQNDLKLRNEVLIYLDNSQSLSLLNEDGFSGFDRAVNEANAIVDTYADGTIFHFIENGYANSISADYTGSSLQELLTEIQQVGVDRQLEEIGSRINGSNLEGDVYYISDFQSKQDFDPLILDTTNNYYLIPIQAQNYSNVFIDTLYLENTFSSGSFANLLKIRLRRNFRDNDVVNLKLLIGDQLFGTAEVDFGNQLIAEHQFEIQANEVGLDRIELQIDDPNLTFDNSFYASINQLDKVKVVEVYDNTTPTFIQSLFDDNEVFQFDRLDSRFLDNELIASANLLIINEIDEMSNQLVNVLNNLITAGGTVMVIPDAVNKPSDFSRLGIVTTSENGNRVELSQPDFENPLFQSVFDGLNENIEMPEATLNFRIMNSELDYLEFRNGRGFLSKINTEGNMFFFASPFEEEYSSFTNHALFVPVMYKLALGSKVSLSNLYYYTDSESIFYPIDNAFGNSIFKLSAEGEDIIPDQRIEGDRLIFEIPKDIIEPGQYALSVNNQTLGTLSFNIPKTESDLKLVDPFVFEDLNLLDHVTVIETSSQTDVEQFLQAGVAGIQLWKYALLGALFFLFVEIILIRYL